MTRPPAPEPLAVDAEEPQEPGVAKDANASRPQGPGLPVINDNQSSDNPIRLTGNTEPRDPFAPAVEESVVVEEVPAEEPVPDDAAVVGDETIDADRVADVGDKSYGLGDMALDDAAEAPEADEAQVAEDDSDVAIADDDASAGEISDGPRMVEPEIDGALPRFAQRSMDDAPSGEPFPADVQDERFLPREPEPGDEELGGGTMPERCPSPRDLKPINQITHRIAAEPGLFPQECVLSDEPFVPRNFACTVFTWKASALCHKPLYFQQAKLERYGHTFGPVLTPVLSTGHFFVSVFALPYKIGMNPPWECMYPLGWYRPGSCAPYTLGPVPISLRGAALQGLVTTGLWFLFP